MYRKKNENLTAIEKILDQPYELYIASDRDSSIFQRLKRDVMHEPGLIILSSLYAIGANKKEILKELIWLQDKHISTIFGDLPATWIFDDPVASDLALRVLIDVYSSLVKNKNFEIPTITGRKKIAFPENWATLYDAWSNELITSKEFIEQSGLKKGTFYHLINEYRELR